ncbi:hypothetical protein BGW38_006234 [Lunasporangiospora selenospora]|uniref:Uncharacterized protein n=1 Tax=Lunasporangiospora selenospora TaxID=979761 RepID=A0A9P6KGX8_9FUNG|nr:hypothetical protein BGW38_006234 [Lunasporangiospora selenospora]
MTVDKYNILLLGQTQSGKSTLIQFFKQYAKPSHVIEKEYIGKNVKSHTDKCLVHEIETNLPLYGVFRASDNLEMEYSLNGNEDCNNQESCSCRSDDFLDELNRRDLRSRQKRHGNEQYRFRFIDTPGLNDTNGKDEFNILEVYNALSAIGPIHLVLVTVPPEAFTDGFVNVFQTYFHVFEELKDKVRFIHTKTDYLDRHHSHRDKHEEMRLRKLALDELLSQTIHDHFSINCDLVNTRPIRACITQNILRNILGEAITSDPVFMSGEMIRKTPRMLEVDALIHEQLYREDDESDAARLAQAKESGGLWGALTVTKRLSADTQTKLNEALDYIQEHKRESPRIEISEESIHEKRKLLPVPGKKRTYKFGPQEHTIDEVFVYNCDGFALLKETGGTKHTSYTLDYRRDPFSSGSMTIKVLVRRDNFYRTQIMEKEGVVSACRETMESVELMEKDIFTKFDKMKEYEADKDVLKLVKRTRIAVILFKQLSRLDFTEQTHVCARGVLDVYRKAIRGNQGSSNGSHSRGPSSTASRSTPVNLELNFSKMWPRHTEE